MTDQTTRHQLADAPDPTPLRWGLNDVMWGDDDSVTVLLSGPDGEPYWLELDPERARVLREDLAGPPVDQTTPSRRAGLRDEIVNALGQIKTVPPVAHRREQADHVLAVLYREWPWLRAEAEDAAPADQAVLERVARRLASRDWLIDETADDDWQRRGPEFRADYMAWAREVVAAVVPATTRHDTDTSAGPVCICGHPEERHFEDVCQTCECGDYLEPGDAAEAIARWREAALAARADWATVLRETADAILASAQDRYDRSYSDNRVFELKGARTAADELRRVADETAATETTADKAARLGMTPEEYRAHRHLAAVGQIRAALPGLYATTGLRVEAALTEPADETAATETQAPCGKDRGVSGLYYQPCARPAGHAEAYCKSADGSHLFLAGQPTVGARQDGAQPDDPDGRHAAARHFLGKEIPIEEQDGAQK